MLILSAYRSPDYNKNICRTGTNAARTGTASDTEHLPMASTAFDHLQLVKLFNKVFMPLGLNVAAPRPHGHGQLPTVYN